MAVSPVDICNRALSKLGARRITSLTAGDRNAQACNDVYESLRDGELEKNPWSFAIKTASLPASAIVPDFDRAREFPLPDDFLRLLSPYPEANHTRIDWIIQLASTGAGRSIYTDEQAPLEIRYVARVTDPNQYSALFVEVLAARIAAELTELLTQSNTKRESLEALYDRRVKEARMTNAIQKRPAEPAEDDWSRLRRRGRHDNTLRSWGWGNY